MAWSDRNAEQLAREAQLASRIRALKTDPDVVALHVERVRTFVDRLLWSAIVLGLLFTMVNVQQFAAAGSAPWSFTWITSWFLDPMLSLALVGVLTAEVVISRYQLRLDFWGQVVKWFTLIAAYVANTWASWAALIPAQVILHSIPVLTVFAVTQASPGVRDRLTEAVIRAAEEAERLASRPIPEPVPAAVPTRLPASDLAAEVPVPLTVVSPPTRASVPVTAPTKPRSEAGSKPANPGQKVTRPDEEIIPELEKLVTDLGHKPGIGTVKGQFGIGSGRAERLLAAVPDPASRNGHRPGSVVTR